MSARVHPYVPGLLYSAAVPVRSSTDTHLAEVLALVDVGECAVADSACLNAVWTTGRGTTLTLGQKRDLGRLLS
jgi:hypothetical protein